MKIFVGAGLGIRFVRQTNNAYTKPALTYVCRAGAGLETIAIRSELKNNGSYLCMRGWGGFGNRPYRIATKVISKPAPTNNRQNLNQRYLGQVITYLNYMGLAIG